VCADCGGELIRLGQDCPVCRARSPNVVYRHRFDADPDPHPNFHVDADLDPHRNFHVDADPDPHPNFHVDVDADPDPILSLPIFGKSRRKNLLLFTAVAFLSFLSAS
jgi:hypothetical protein